MQKATTRIDVTAAWRRGNIRQVIFAARYGAHLGNYMMHCHDIVHEDHDMLRAFLVRRSLLCPSDASYCLQPFVALRSSSATFLIV